MKRSFFSREPLETVSLAQVQFVIDSCCPISQSNHLNNSNKDYDLFILACFVREQMHADATFTRLENKVWLKKLAEYVWKLMDSLSSEAGETLDYVSCFPYTSFVPCRFLGA